MIIASSGGGIGPPSRTESLPNTDPTSTSTPTVTPTSTARAPYLPDTVTSSSPRTSPASGNGVWNWFQEHVVQPVSGWFSNDVVHPLQTGLSSEAQSFETGWNKAWQGPGGQLITQLGPAIVGVAMGDPNGTDDTATTDTTTTDMTTTDTTTTDSATTDPAYPTARSIVVPQSGDGTDGTVGNTADLGLPNLNPNRSLNGTSGGPGTSGYNQNCTAMAQITDRMLRGVSNPETGTDFQAQSLADIERRSGGTFQPVTPSIGDPYASVEQDINARGPGATGIVSVQQTIDGRTYGHVFNVANINGHFVAIDAQNGTWSTNISTITNAEGYTTPSNVQYLRTN